MNKKGQVTLFIILAIVIFVSAILYFSFRDTITQRVGGFSGTLAVKEYVEECIFSVSEEVIYAVGNGGGHFFSPEESDGWGFSYQEVNGENYFPNLEDLENEINLFVAINMFGCLNNFEQFTDFEIIEGKMKVVSEILNDSVEIEVMYPLSIKKGDEIVRYEDFEKAIIPVRLGEMHFVMGNLIGENYYNEEGICISCIIDLAYEHGFVFETYNYDNNDLFILQDLENEKTEEPFKFVFVNRRFNEA
jgi:hypothetical protein